MKRHLRPAPTIGPESAIQVDTATSGDRRTGAETNRDLARLGRARFIASEHSLSRLGNEQLLFALAPLTDDEGPIDLRPDLPARVRQILRAYTARLESEREHLDRLIVWRYGEAHLPDRARYETLRRRLRHERTRVFAWSLTSADRRELIDAVLRPRLELFDGPWEADVWAQANELILALEDRE